MKFPIYMDHHATTPIEPQVLEAMMPYLTLEFGNPSSATHVFGWKAEEAVETARAQVANLVGASSEEVIFTSGATESDNLALKGVARANKNKGNRIIVSKVEHKAVLDSCKTLEKEGFEVIYIPVDKYGMINPQDVEAAITPNVILISIIYAHNEIGTINPIAEIGEIAQKHEVLFHSDAVQGVGKINSNVDQLKVDLMSISAHKIYGPKGVGALYLRKKRPKIKLEPLIDGGGHERKLRSGTLNVPGIVGFGKACEICQKVMPEEADRILTLRNRLYKGISGRIDYVHLNGHPAQRLPGNLNLSFEFVEGETLILGLKKVAVSSGAACTSVGMEASYVLLEMGVEEHLAHSSIRFGLGRYNTEEEVEVVIEEVEAHVKKLREASPNYKLRKEGIM